MYNKLKPYHFFAQSEPLRVINDDSDGGLMYFNGLYRNMNVVSKFKLKIKKILHSGIVYEEIEAFGYIVDDINISGEYIDMCEITINVDYIHNNISCDG